jgi:hypothetical protein
MRTGVSGTVIAVQGNVLDVAFAQDLPPLHRALLAQGPRPVVLEVASHLDAQTVRCIALTPTGCRVNPPRRVGSRSRTISNTALASRTSPSARAGASSCRHADTLSPGSRPMRRK